MEEVLSESLEGRADAEYDWRFDFVSSFGIGLERL